MAEQQIRKRIHRSAVWGELVSDISVVISSNISGHGRPAPSSDAGKPAPNHTVDQPREAGKEVRDERE